MRKKELARICEALLTEVLLRKRAAQRKTAATRKKRAKSTAEAATIVPTPAYKPIHNGERSFAKS